MLVSSKLIGLTLVLTLLAGCGGTGAGVGTTTTMPFVRTADARNMAQTRIPSVSGSRAQEVQATFVGPRDDIVNGLGPNLYAGGPVPAPDVQRYLEAVRDRLLAQWPYERPNVPFRVEILPSSGFAADSFADGVIRINVGILQQAQTESELAFIIGHEAAHLLLKHQIRREDQLGAAERVAQAVRSAGAVRAITRRKHKGTDTKVAAYLRNNAILAGDTASGMLVEDAMQVIFDAGWSREQEEQADLIGIDLMTGAGYNPSYVDQMFDGLMESENGASPQEEELRKDVGGGAVNLPALIGQFNPAAMIQNGLYYLNGRIKTLAISHPETVARKDAAGAYRDKYYASALGRTSKSEDGLARLKRNVAYSSMVQAVRHVRLANEKLSGDGVDGALQEARAAEQLSPNWWATHYLIACAMLEHGETAPALVELQRALVMPGVPYGAFERTAFEFASRGDVGSALRVMAMAERHFGGPEVTWPDRIVLYRVQKNQSGAERTLQTCDKSENAKQRNKCLEAARRPVELASN